MRLALVNVADSIMSNTTLVCLQRLKDGGRYPVMFSEVHYGFQKSAPSRSSAS